MNKLVKVNIGCGPQSKSDWINLDYGIVSFLSQFPWLFKLFVGLGLLSDFHYQNIPRIHDCTKKLPFKNNPVDFIYTSHFIEHLYRYETVRFLKECKRVLRQKGILRIAVPDLKLLVQKYIGGDKDYFICYFGSNNDALSNNIADLLVATFFGFDTGSKVRPRYLNRLKSKLTRGHHWMYDFDPLKEILKTAGFNEIKRCNFKEGDTPDIQSLDNFPLGLYLEAR
jgi:SAM-dependent methyltransferase